MTTGVVGTGVFSFITLGQPEERLPQDPARGAKEAEECKECAGGKDQKQESCSSDEASRR
jgi:hypothetical protein